MENMTKKEIIRQLEITKECDVDTVAQIKAINEAIYFLRNYFVDFNKMNPLTPEQLREMDGQPVWVEFEDGSGGLWGIVHISVFEQIVFPNGLHCTIGHPYYGKTYKAYAYHPANIDREEWKPCYACKSCGNCEEAWKATGERINYAHPCYSCLDESNFRPVGFCRKCGRPLTQEAWAMREKRLRGN